ncbi:MAG: hypothetical protein RLZZ359_973 [Actinomycetota bacterium]
MAPKKKITGMIKLQINAGAANPYRLKSPFTKTAHSPSFLRPHQQPS